MSMKRSQKATSTRLAIIQALVNMFHGFHPELENIGDSGANTGNLVRLFLPPV
jgi:hypothetical protein